MFSTLPLVAAALALVGPTAVSAHGYVKKYEIGSQTYPAWDPFNDPYASPVPNRIERHIPDDGPVLDVTSPDIACNKGGETGVNAFATIAAGDKITFDWTNWPADHQGPVSTYMASCNGDCSKFDVSDAKWFKIDAAGYSNGKWAATQLIDNGYKWTSVIPSELKAGEYLVRHEIVALHSVGQPQFYPGCAQVKVTGSGSKEPSGSELVSLPGLYNNIKWPDIWDDSFHSFVVPGPAPAFSGSSSGSDDTDSTPASSTPAHTSSAAPEKASSTQVHTATTTSVHTSAPATSSQASTASRASSVASSSKPTTTGTGRCSAKRRRGMVKRHVSHHAKRHH
ncbi:Auxilliary Activities Family 9 protein [Trametes cinnabarina]|uniref:lytic cellulose monooxygenase (C4-dehydrogenating) n=1 Tax=Pycnoporus cinnabarinus TaxID=5643 RepID=A0A060SJX3_PYCCI|nr:Auxilliary Activities Family 9 protein [Trametes cinnabarina]